MVSTQLSISEENTIRLELSCANYFTAIGGIIRRKQLIERNAPNRHVFIESTELETKLRQTSLSRTREFWRMRVCDAGCGKMAHETGEGVFHDVERWRLGQKKRRIGGCRKMTDGTGKGVLQGVE